MLSPSLCYYWPDALLRKGALYLIGIRKEIMHEKSGADEYIKGIGQEPYKSEKK